MGPQQGLAVDVFLEQTLAQHQAERAPCPAPGLVGRLVNDVAEVIQPPWVGGLPGFHPFLPRLAALPGARREAQDLHLHTTTLQGAGHDVGAHGRDGDGAPAHGARVVEQQGHHRVAEVGVALQLEGQRVQRIGDDTRQTPGIQQAILQVEVPGPGLLGHQAALQAVGESRHQALHVGELAVELAAQAVELRHLAELLGVDHVVEFGRVGAVGRAGSGFVGGPVVVAVAGAGRALLSMARDLVVVSDTGFAGFRFHVALAGVRQHAVGLAL